MSSTDALKGIESAAFALVAQREKIRIALQGLRATVEVFDPNYTLDDEGHLVEVNVAAPPLPPPRPTPPPEPRAAIEAASVSRPPAEPLPAEPPPVDREVAIMEFISGSNSGRHVTQIGKQFPQWSTKPILDNMVAQGLLKTDSSGMYKRWDAPTTKPSAAASRGSGRRQDISGSSTGSATSTPKTTTSRSGTGTKSEAQERSTSTSVPSPTSPSSSEPTSTTPERTSPAPVSSVNRNHDGTYGLARSPKPRSEMREQQRISEKRLDTIILWAQDQTGIIDVLTCTRDLEPDWKFGTASSKTLQSKYSADFRTLVERKILEPIPEWEGKDYFPEWWLQVRGKSGGRGTKAYRLNGSTESPKAEPTQPTQAAGSVATPKSPATPVALRRPSVELPTLEKTRDAAVKLKKFELRAILAELGLPNTRLTRRAVHESLAALVNRGMFKLLDDQPGIPKTWEYITIDGPGAAARFDMERPRGLPSQPTGPAQAVAGSGRDATSKIKNPEVRRLIEAAKKIVGAANVNLMPSGHWEIRNGDRKVLVSNTPSGSRTVLNDRARLRRIGVAIP